MAAVDGPFPLRNALTCRSSEPSTSERARQFSKRVMIADPPSKNAMQRNANRFWSIIWTNPSEIWWIAPTRGVAGGAGCDGLGDGGGLAGAGLGGGNGEGGGDDGGGGGGDGGGIGGSLCFPNKM